MHVLFENKIKFQCVKMLGQNMIFSALLAACSHDVFMINALCFITLSSSEKHDVLTD